MKISYIEITKEHLKTINKQQLSLWLEEEEDYIPFILFSPNELEDEQIGYSRLENGESLTGTAAGDWRESWVVIGYREDVGDPLFVDAANGKSPVYTAEHGTGDWEPILLFGSWEELKSSKS